MLIPGKSAHCVLANRRWDEATSKVWKESTLAYSTHGNLATHIDPYI
jgi:hypothetical protein